MNKYLKFLILIRIFISLIVSDCAKTHSNTVNYKKIQNHLIQLEHIYNAHSQCLKEFQKQILEIEQEIDYLRGKMQENEYQLLKITEQQDNIVNIINSFEEKKLNIKNNTDTNILTSLKNKKNTPIIHTNNNHSVDYKKAVNLVLEKKKYEQAIQSFQTFILKYPNSTYQANAHYWLGQLNYRKGNKNDASYHFALVAKNYPKSLKASDSLLKVGIIMEEIGYKDQAKLIYKKINYLYPNTDASKYSKKRLTNY